MQFVIHPFVGVSVVRNSRERLLSFGSSYEYAKGLFGGIPELVEAWNSAVPALSWRDGGVTVFFEGGAVAAIMLGDGTARLRSKDKEFVGQLLGMPARQLLDGLETVSPIRRRPGSAFAESFGLTLFENDGVTRSVAVTPSTGSGDGTRKERDDGNLFYELETIVRGCLGDPALARYARSREIWTGLPLSARHVADVTALVNAGNIEEAWWRTVGDVRRNVGAAADLDLVAGGVKLEAKFRLEEGFARDLLSAARVVGEAAESDAEDVRTVIHRIEDFFAEKTFKYLAKADVEPAATEAPEPENPRAVEALRRAGLDPAVLQRMRRLST